MLNLDMTEEHMKALERPSGFNAQSYLSKKQLRAFCGGVSASSIDLWIRTKGFPRPLKLSQTMPVWKIQEVIDWMENHPRKSITEPAVMGS